MCASHWTFFFNFMVHVFFKVSFYIYHIFLCLLGYLSLPYWFIGVLFLYSEYQSFVSYVYDQYLSQFIHGFPFVIFIIFFNEEF